MLEWLSNVDGAVLLWIQQTIRCTLLDTVLIYYTQLGDAGMMWIVLSVLMLCFPQTRKAGIIGLLALLLSLLLTNVTLKHLVGRVRPWLTLEGLIPLISEHDPNSFPSGHTCAAFAAASAWYRALPKRWMCVLGIIMAAVMGLSRLYVGVHFPSDVLAGLLVGLLCGWLAWLIWQQVPLGRRLEPPGGESAAHPDEKEGPAGKDENNEHL